MATSRYSDWLGSNPDRYPDRDNRQRYDDHQHINRQPCGYALCRLGHSVSLRGHVMYRKRASGCERVHMLAQSLPSSLGSACQLRSRWSRDTGIAVVFRRWPRLQGQPRCSERGLQRIRNSSKRSPDERSDIRGCGSDGLESTSSLHVIASGAKQSMFQTGACRMGGAKRYPSHSHPPAMSHLQEDF